jgi:glycosyltransferase involved in cell wall biosynthesis
MKGMTPEHPGFVLSVVIPAYNEGATLEEAIRRVREMDSRAEIICVDDGSTDGSAAILHRLADEGIVDRVIIQPSNRGKGRAVRAGIAVATGHAIVIQDADLEYDPADLPAMLEPILAGKADAVFGSRFLGGPHRVLYFWHRVGNGLLTLLSNMLTDLNLTDMETGYKLVRSDLMKGISLRCERFGIEPEITARLAQARARIYEVPITYNGRTYLEGKKIGWRDGVAALWHIVRANVTGRRAARYDFSRPLVAPRPAPEEAQVLTLTSAGIQ